MRLLLTFWKHDREAGNSLIGEVPVDLSTMYPGARMDSWLPLLKSMRSQEDEYNSEDEPSKPSVLTSLKAADLKGDIDSYSFSFSFWDRDSKEALD